MEFFIFPLPSAPAAGEAGKWEHDDLVLVVTQLPSGLAVTVTEVEQVHTFFNPV